MAAAAKNGHTTSAYRWNRTFPACSPDVLVVAQLAARLEDAPQLGQGADGVAHRAQHEGHHRDVERRVVQVEVLGDARTHRDRDGRGVAAWSALARSRGSGSRATTSVTSGG